MKSSLVFGHDTQLNTPTMFRGKGETQTHYRTGFIDRVIS